MEFRLLGPLELEGEHGVVSVGSGKQRALLAILLLHANERLSRERLIDELWDEEPPASAAHSLEVYVSRLRKTLHEAGGDGALATRGNGYLLQVGEEDSDAGRFRRLLDAARSADPAREAALLRDALALWRGPALADVELTGSARAAAENLNEQRLVALEERIEADLALGRHRQVVGELQALVAEHPLRERLRSQHMRALYGAGRQAEALDSYRDAQRELAELGLEPSPDLKTLQRQILNHDPLLRVGAPEPVSASSRGRRRRWVLAGGIAVVALAGAAVAAIAVAATGGSGSTPVSAVDNSVGLLDLATNRLVADIPIGGSPSNGHYHGAPNIAFGLGSIWVCNADDSTLLRIDPRSHRVVRTTGLGVAPAAVTVGHGAVWVTGGTQVVKLDSLGNVSQRIPLPHATVLSFAHGPGSISSGPDAIWVVYGVAEVAKIDPRSGRVLLTAPNVGGVLPGQILATPDGIWLTGLDQGLLVELNPATGKVATTTTPSGAGLPYWSEVTRGPGGLWVTDTTNDTVWRVDPTAIHGTSLASVDRSPNGIAIRGRSVWVASFLGGTLQRIDPTTMRVVARVRTGAHPSDLVYGPGGLWMTFGGAVGG
jgi:DNA-binding SARP family transcriptional activator/streptogramin lyase